MRSTQRLLSTIFLAAALCACANKPKDTVAQKPATHPAATTRAAHNFARWEKAIADFEAADRANPPPQGAVLFTGSSTIRLWTTLQQDLPNHKVINRGFGGNEIVDCMHFADRMIFPYQPRMVVLRAGGNDLWGGKTPEQVFHDFQDFVTTMKSRLPQAQIVFIGLSPSISRWRQH